MALGDLGTVEISNPAVPVSGTVGVSTPALTIRASGNVAAPTASAVLADTGALVAGSYRVDWFCAALDTLAVGKGCVVEHRNAANNATTHTLGGCVAGTQCTGDVQRVIVATNERVRVIAGTAAGAASSRYLASLSLYPVT